MSILMWILLILISIFCVYIGKNLSNSILHPIRLMSIIWIAFIFFPILFWKTGYKWNGSGLIWILLSVLFTELGALVVNKKRKKENNLEKKNFSFDWKILILIIFLGLNSFLLKLNESGFSLNDFTSFDSLIDMNKEVAYQRYYGETENSTISQILLIFVYGSSLCGGYSYNFAKNRKQKILSTLGAILPLILMMLFTNTKQGFIAGVILWLAGWCICNLLIKRELPKINYKRLLQGIIIFFIIIFILYFIMLLRTGDFSKRMRNIIYEKFWFYAFGQVVNFDYWFDNLRSYGLADFGVNTYMSIFKTFGLVTRVQGVYTTELQGYGNIFTAFRGVIMDFGTIGGLMYCFLRGMITQYCYNRLISGSLKVSISCSLLACAYLWNILGFIISPWVYTSYVLTMIMFWGFLFLVHKRIKFEGKYENEFEYKKSK